MKKKLLTLLATASTVAPVAASLACGTSDGSDDMIILVGKTQIQKQGEQFAKLFQGKADFKDVANGAKNAKFITKNGDKFKIELSTTFGTKRFPATFTAANTTLVKEYLDKKAVTIFHDPKYHDNDSDGIWEAADKTAEKFNENLAGSKVNLIIKALQMQGKDNLMLKDDKNNILGFPTYTEAMGLIYNKGLFKEAGITIDIHKTKPSGVVWSNIQSKTPTKPASDITINPILDLTNAEKTKELLRYIKNVLKATHPNLKEIGISTKGTNSWAFSSKVLLMTGISAAAIEAGLMNKGAVIPGGDYSNDASRLTPDRAKNQLFSKAADKGVAIAKEAFEFFLDKDYTKNYPLNVDMYNDFQAGNILTMPQGTWVEGTLNKTAGLKYGYLPIPLTGANGKIAFDTSSYWIISDQVNSNKRSAAEAKAVRTQAVNFIYNQYLTEDGAKNLEIAEGLNNPYTKTNKYLKAEEHPLITDANKYPSIPWGASFNLPGTGAKGYERNNAEWTALIDKYYNDGTSAWQSVEAELLKIWK